MDQQGQHHDDQKGFPCGPGDSIAKALVAPQWLIEIEAVAAAKA